MQEVQGKRLAFGDPRFSRRDGWPDRQGSVYHNRDVHGRRQERSDPRWCAAHRPYRRRSALRTAEEPEVGRGDEDGRRGCRRAGVVRGDLIAGNPGDEPPRIDGVREKLGKTGGKTGRWKNWSGKTGQPELRDFRLSRLLRKQRQLAHDFRGWGGVAFLLGPPARPMPTELFRYRLNELFIAKRTPRECSSPQRLHSLTTFKPGICSKWRTLAVPPP